MDRSVTAVVFEGGQAQTSLDKIVRHVRTQVVLDTLAKLAQASEIGRVILVTNNEGLAGKASQHAEVDFDSDKRRFHFGVRLRELIVKYNLDRVIYMGGAAAPLMTAGEFNEIALSLKTNKNVVVVNNVQSADLVAFTPARAIDEIDLPESDNSLGNLLRGIGMRRILIPNSGRINFDLDTPVDIQILGMHPDCGPRTLKAIESLDWPRDRLEQALRILRQDSREIAVFGRVGPSVIQYINTNMVHRMRVYSEERGMKALGRDERGEVVSLIGYMIEELGPCKFFEYVSRVCDLAFIDSRVVFAHLNKQVSDWDRFQSDLGRYELIGDEWVREFTRCALESPIPVILGGHSLVAAGLWILAEMVVSESEGYR